jgi:hypothetical protein
LPGTFICPPIFFLLISFCLAKYIAKKFYPSQAEKSLLLKGFLFFLRNFLAVAGIFLVFKGIPW